MSDRPSFVSQARWVVLLTLAVLLAGVALPSAQLTSAAPGTTYKIRLASDSPSTTRGTAVCKRGDTLFEDIVVSKISCNVGDAMADRYHPFVVVRYWNGSVWKVVPGFENRKCTNQNGAGSTMTCKSSFNVLSDVPGTSSYKVKIRIGLVNRLTGQVVNTKEYTDEWSTAV